MDYIIQNIKCDKCQKEIDEVEVMHGIAFDEFVCPHCGEQNKI